MMSWAQIKSAWSSGWSALQTESMRLYEAAIRADPTGYLGRVQAFVQELGRARGSLNRIKDKLPNPPRTAEDRALHAKYRAMEARYHDLAAGLYADAQPAQTEVGAAPLVVGVVVGGVVIGVDTRVKSVMLLVRMPVKHVDDAFDILLLDCRRYSLILHLGMIGAMVLAWRWGRVLGTCTRPGARK